MTDEKNTGDDQNVELSFEVYETYDGSQIQVLEGLEAVRRRPGMYIGTTDTRGLHHLVIELIDNGVDEGMAGFAKNIYVRIMKDGGVRVTDDGRGIPVDWNNDHQMSSLELIMTKLHSGGKFTEGAYKFSGGLHGVGLSVVNALSISTIVEIFRPEVRYRQVYERGIPVSGIEETEFTGSDAPEGIIHGTAIYFDPDPDIFESVEFLFETLDARVKEMAYLTAGLRLSLIDEREEPIKEVSYRYEDGIKQFVRDRNTHKEALIDNSEFVFYAEGEEDGVIVEIALTYNNGYNRILSGFVNGINTREGGTHISGFRSALTRSVNDFGRSSNLFKGKESNLSGEDIREGLVAIISVKHTDPQFEGQTKTRLGNSEVDGITQRIFFAKFQEYLLDNPNFGKAIMLKSIQARRAREAAQKTRNLVRSKGARVSLPGRLVPSREKDPAKRELFLVEGQSAGGTAVKARDSQYQEILFLKGKVLNVEKARIDKILDNQEIKHIIMALGTGIGEEFDITHCRYGKVILLSVAGDEPVLLQHNDGRALFTKIGDFIDDMFENNISKPELAEWNVACFDLETNSTKLAPLKNIIRHHHDEPLYEIKTLYNRKVKVTGGHSIFVYENGKVIVKPADQIKVGDYVVAPKKIPSLKKHTKINILEALFKQKKIRGLWLRGSDVRETSAKRVLEEIAISSGGSTSKVELMSSPRIILSQSEWRKLVQHRTNQGVTQKEVANLIGIKQAITISHYERQINLPIKPVFDQYLNSINFKEKLSSYRIIPSKIDELKEPNQSKNDKYRKISDYKPISWFTEDELLSLNGSTKIVPRAHHEDAFPLTIDLTRELAYFLGWYAAEGSLDSRSKVRLSLGKKDDIYHKKLNICVKKCFGKEGKFFISGENSRDFYINSTFARSVIKAVGLDKRSYEKRIPNVIFSATSDMQLEFLQGYFLGDGSLSKSRLSVTTTSNDLKNGVLYLLGMNNIIASTSVHYPDVEKQMKAGATIISRRPRYDITICGKRQLQQIKQLWSEFYNAERTEKFTSKLKNTIKQQYKPISSDLIGLKVKEITKIPFAGDVYDFSVENDENFIAGAGAICCHNSDADVDGAHITTLLLTLFYRLMRPLFDYGIIYVAKPPLFRVAVPIKKQIKHLGPKNESYLATEDERNELVAKLVESGVRENRIQVQRYKGLGEMNADQLEITAMDPDTRGINKILVRNEDEAEELFTVLMGDDVKARREFIVREVFKKELSLDEAVRDVDPIIEKVEDEVEESEDPITLYLEEGDELDESEVFKESSEIFEGDEEIVDLIENEDSIEDENNEPKKKKRFGIF
ncbi:MAG: ATP-binding protein [Candidatus Kariarchaeaceae archaeon]